MILKIPKTKFVGNLNLKITLDSDQCPADIWNLKDERYTTFFRIKNRWISVLIWENRDTLFVESKIDVSQKILYHFWFDYNIPKFYKKFNRDQYLSKIIKVCKGLRVMRDLDIIYRIIEAILTQNSSVKQIRNMEGNLRKFYGNGYTFDLEKIANASEKELQLKCKAGYRAKYIINVAKKLQNGELNIKEIKQKKSKDARKLLLEIDGVGPKITDIILLYGFGKSDVFPMDVWLRRALIREYFKGKKVSDKKLREFAINYFGKHAGIAHLYMFYYERKIVPPRNSKSFGFLPSGDITADKRAR